MHTDMESFDVEEEQLQGMVMISCWLQLLCIMCTEELTTRLWRVKLEVDLKVVNLQASQTKKGTEFIIGHLDKDTKSEFMDNLWLSKQV